MTDEQPNTPTGRLLTDPRATRIDFARRDLETARTIDLAQLEPAALILLIERLKTRLDDMLRLADEINHPQ
ncbi:hypothetical protein ACIQ9J_01210 [Streptomyces sp. NPDC094153]|uniref:hypothetical protein n=1 Tax=Streptomyces sp. NPDC094153 TaxID=3366058 RepID=UPI00381ADE4B